MIDRFHRLHGRAAITRLYSGGKTVRSGGLALRYAPNPRRKTYRAAVVVSRKVSKSAVVRNRIRRRIYEHVRILFGDFTGGYDLAFIVYDAHIAAMPAVELGADIGKLCKKAGLLAAAAKRHAIVEPKE